MIGFGIFRPVMQAAARGMAWRAAPSGAVPVVVARMGQHLARVAAWFWPGSSAQLVASPNNAGWRADIDGLRALAVVGVVVYHVFPAALPGGFGGVDAFFVISGFLISGHLVVHFAAGRFSVAAFFARRVRRLAPALLVVLAATLLAGWFTLLPTELAAVGLDAAAGAASVANLLMWHAQGYFDRAAVLKPLLHLWSLGVEEQFYLLWPLVLALGFAARVRAGVLVGATGAACFLYSLACSAWWPGAGFYSPLSRGWEFMLGAGLALHGVAARGPEGATGGVAPAHGARAGMGRMLARCAALLRAGNVRHGAAVLGLACVLAGFVVLRPGVGFPAPFALLPAGGTALLIWAGAGAWVNRHVLAVRPMRAVGLISYPLYLWHWPLVSWFHIVRGAGVIHNSAGFALMGAALVLAWLTTKYVENPLRGGHFRQGKTAALVGGLAAICTAGLVTWHTAGWPARFAHTPAGTDLSAINLAVRDGIFAPTPHMHMAHENGLTVATIGHAGRPIMFTGDSLLFQWGPRVEALLQQGRLKHTVIFVAGPSCSPFAGEVYEKSFAYCRNMQNVQQRIIQQQNVQAVVVGAFWPRVLLHTPGTQAQKQAGFVQDMRGLSGNGARPVWLVLPTPADARFSPDKLVARSLTHIGVNTALLAQGVPTQQLRTDTAADTAFVRALAAQAGAKALDAWPDICGTGPACAVITPPATPKYADDKHLRPGFVQQHATFLDEVLAR
ncbi:acyltransferase family protein [Acetobacter ascendens]|uniref:Putative O-acetyltransferase n=1 Tax=Acetobacter ascendens TaxID=481146 RepID=A0A1Y0V1K0_9PROT|nr:acyltransferase family protein [Acetobacter ascendens]ARW09769.1 Putative O-acetyltransferase [Acetobacter ascendens]